MPVTQPVLDYLKWFASLIWAQLADATRAGTGEQSCQGPACFPRVVLIFSLITGNLPVSGSDWFSDESRLAANFPRHLLLCRDKTITSK